MIEASCLRRVLLGEPTRGKRRGIDGGALFVLHLPEGRVDVDLRL